MNIYEIEAQVILPFRAAIPPLTVTFRVPTDEWGTTFEVTYFRNITLFEGYSLDTTLCTFLTIKSFFVFNGDRVEAGNWLQGNASLLTPITIARINHFLTILKHNSEDLLATGVIRNVGEIDFIFYSLIYDRQSVFSRGTSTFIFGLGVDFENMFGGKQIGEANIKTDNPAKEWAIITRAVDLLNHGYFLESFIVAFSLLDDVVQQFIITKLPNLEKSEAKQLLRRIESQRLETYLGTLSRLAIGISILDNKEDANNIKWINTKRNKVMHGGEEISLEEAQRGITIVFDTLAFLNRHGANLDLPQRLNFWTQL